MDIGASPLTVATRDVTSPLCRTAWIINKLLWKKLVGNASKRFPSGKWISAWHSGHRNFPCLWLTLACFPKHSQQNVWKYIIIFGSLKVSRQIEQVTCLVRFLRKDSIVCVWYPVNTACLKFREKQHVVEWSYELKLITFGNWAIITQSGFCCRRSWPIRFLFCFDCLHVFALLISRLRRQVKNWRVDLSILSRNSIIDH